MSTNATHMEIKMFVIQRLYAGNKYFSGSDYGWSSNINDAIKFDSELQARSAKKYLKLSSVRIVKL